jgi:ABC-type multidrug transport system ATPase subunit
MNPLSPLPPTPASGNEGTTSRGFLRTHGRVTRLVRRITGRATQQQLLPVLIKVYAGFSKFDGKASEEEVESSLGFMRGDYPGAVYSELQALYRQALRETQDLDAIAAQLRGLLSHDEKIQLAVQLYVLITRSTMPREEMAAFEKFLSGIGIASEGRNLIGQLSEESPHDAPPGSMLELLDIGGQAPAHLVLDHVSGPHALTVFRFQNLLLLKRTGSAQVIARGRRLGRGEFLRLYEGQRVVVGEHVLYYQDLVFYLNARKGVSSTQLYLSLGGGDAPFVERERSRHSVLRIQFGLAVQVEALRASPVKVGGQPLVRGQTVAVSLSGRITFPDDTSLTFAELRRRAREMGGRFNLHPGRSDYRISNNAALLREGDILLSPVLRSEMLLRITCDYENKTGELEVLRSPRALMVEKVPVREKERVTLKDGAIISLGEGQQLRCRFSDGIIEEERNIIRQLDVRDVTHRFGRIAAVDGISFSVRRGEMICVLGPSGSGKSCLLRILAGHLKPTTGKVAMNSQPLYDNTARLAPFISYIPHEDAFDPLLTVEENLACAATMRSPHLQSRDIRRRVDAKLIELGLNERRKAVAGMPEQKTLSSGERKRLNIGLDMITPADVFLFDEPTSGLSSKDSEHVLEIIRGLAHNKIVFVSIHQPSARLFHMFNKAILLDDGGKMVFFGRPQDMLDYFRDAWEEQLALPARDAGAHVPQPDFHQPEFIFDVLETPLRDLGGDVLYEEDARGHMAPARRFPPEFWRDRYHTRIVMGEVREATLRSEETSQTMTPTSVQDAPVKPPPRERSKRLGVMLRRAFLNRLRNRANMATTLIEAPLLAVLIGLVLRWSKDGDYNFASAFHIPTYLFLSLIVAMFLGLTNSADEIIRDRILLQRERNYNRNVTGFILAKVLALGTVSLLQNVIFILIGNRILEIKEMFFVYLGWMFATSLCGVGIGLLISSLVRDAKTALNIIPLVLIPQIILGGALIKYEEMNRNLDFVYSIRRWAGGEAVEKRSALQVPFIGSLMPLRWSYESMVISQATMNPFSAAQEEITSRIHRLPPANKLTPEQSVQLDDLKNALALISGLEESTPRKLIRRIEAIMSDLDAGTFNVEKHTVPDANRKLSAVQVYENQKILDLYNKAEIVRMDSRIPPHEPKPNVFFGHDKQYTWRFNLFGREWTPLDLKIKTVDLNTIVLVLWIFAPLVMLYFVLRRQLRRV